MRRSALLLPGVHGGVTEPAGASHSSNGRANTAEAASRAQQLQTSAASFPDDRDRSTSSAQAAAASAAAAASSPVQSMQHARSSSSVSSSADSQRDPTPDQQDASSSSSGGHSSAAQPAASKGKKKKGKQKAQTQPLLQPQSQMPTARQSSADSNASGGSSSASAVDSAGPASAASLSRAAHHSRSASQLHAPASSATLEPPSPSPSPASAASASSSASSSSARTGRNASQRPAPPVAAYSVTSGPRENGVAMPSTHVAQIPVADRLRKKQPPQSQSQLLESPPPRLSAASPLDVSPPVPAMSPAATVSAALQSRANAAAPHSTKKERAAAAAAAAAAAKADLISSSGNTDSHDVDPPLPRSTAAAAARRGPPAAAPVSAWSKRAAAAPAAPAPTPAPAMAYSAALLRDPDVSRKSSISSDSSGESASSNSAAAAAAAAAAWPGFPSPPVPSAVNSCPPADPICSLREFPSTPPRASPSSTASPARARLLMSKQGLASIRNLISQPQTGAAGKRGASKSGSSTPAAQADASQTTPPSAPPSAAASSGNLCFAGSNEWSSNAAAPAAVLSTSSPPAAAGPAFRSTAKAPKNPPPTFAVSLMAAAPPSPAAAAAAAPMPPLLKSSSPTKTKTRPLLTSALAAVSQQQSDSKRSASSQQQHHHSSSSPLSFSSSRSELVAPVFPIPSALSSPSAAAPTTPMPSHHPTFMHVLSDPSSSAPMAHSSSSLSSSRAMTPYGASDATAAHSSPDYSLRTSPRSSLPPSAAQFTRSAPASPAKRSSARRREARLSDIHQQRTQQSMHDAAEHEDDAVCSELKRSASSPTLSSSLSLLDRSARFADAGFRSLNASFDRKRHSRAQDDTNHHHHSSRHRHHAAHEEEGDHSDQEEAEAEVEKTKQRLMGGLGPALRKHSRPAASAAAASAGDDFASEDDYDEDHRALDANYDEIESEEEEGELEHDNEQEEEEEDVGATESEYAGCTSANRSIEASDADSSRDLAEADARLKRSPLRTPHSRRRARRMDGSEPTAADASAAGHASTTASSSSSNDSSLSYSSTPASLSPSAPGEHPAVEYTTLHYQFPEIARMLGPNQEEQGLRRAVSKRVGEAVWALWPDAEVHLIGSVATNLFLPDSDIDLVIRNPPSKPKLSITDLYALGEHLTPMASSINIIPTASVPLIKIVDRETNYTVDLTLNVETGLYSTSYVIEQLELFPGLLHPLAIVLKQLLKAKNLNDLFSGGLPSYNLILMIVSFLQQHTVEAHKAQRDREAQMQQQQQQQQSTATSPPPLLASNGVPTRRASAAESASSGSALLSMSSSVSSSSSSSAPSTSACSPTIPLRTQLTKSSGELESGAGASLTTELSLHCPPCTVAGSSSKSPSSAAGTAGSALGVVIPPSPHVLDPLHPDLGEYLLAFLHLYGTTFSYAVLGISLRTGYFLKASRDWLHPHNPHLLALENPMDPSIDLGFKVFRMAEIRTLFQESYATLKAGKGFPPTAAATPAAATVVDAATVVEPPPTRAPVVSHHAHPQLPHRAHAPQLRSASETSQIILSHSASSPVMINGHGFMHTTHAAHTAAMLYHHPQQHPGLSTPLYVPVAAPVGGAPHFALISSSQSAPHSTAHSPYLSQHHLLGAGPSTFYLPPAARQSPAQQQQQQQQFSAGAAYSRSGYSSAGSIPSASVSRGTSPCLSDSSSSAAGLLPTPNPSAAPLTLNATPPSLSSHAHGLARGSSGASAAAAAASYPQQSAYRVPHVNGKHSPFGAPAYPKHPKPKSKKQSQLQQRQQQAQGYPQQQQPPQPPPPHSSQKHSKRDSPPRQFEQ